MAAQPAPQTVTLIGLSGRQYVYGVYNFPDITSFEAVPGNYAFARPAYNGRPFIIYVGQTGDLSQRFDFHHKLPCIGGQGATHILAHSHYGGETARLIEEADLIRAYRPPCNG